MHLKWSALTFSQKYKKIFLDKYKKLFAFFTVITRHYFCLVNVFFLGKCMKFFRESIKKIIQA